MSKVNVMMLKAVLECAKEATEGLWAHLDQAGELDQEKTVAAIKELQVTVERTLDEVNVFIKAEGLDIDHVTTQRRAQKVAVETTDPALPLNGEVTPKRTRTVKMGGPDNAQA